MKLTLIIIIFLLIGAFFIISENKLTLRDSEARVEFGKLYLGWFGQILENSKNLIGYVVKLDWLPENRTR